MKDGSLKQGTRALLEMLEDGIFLELRESHHYWPKTDLRGDHLSEGDVVLMHNESKLRGF